MCKVISTFSGRMSSGRFSYVICKYTTTPNIDGSIKWKQERNTNICRILLLFIFHCFQFPLRKLYFYHSDCLLARTEWLSFCKAAVKLCIQQLTFLVFWLNINQHCLIHVTIIIIIIKSCAFSSYTISQNGNSPRVYSIIMILVSSYCFHHTVFKYAQLGLHYILNLFKLQRIIIEAY